MSIKAIWAIRLHQTPTVFGWRSSNCASLKRRFVLLPCRPVMECRFTWTTCFHYLVRDYGRMPEMLAELHFLSFVIMLLARFVRFMIQSA